METLTRNDIHAPSVIDPTAYSFVALDCLGTPKDDIGEIMTLAENRRIFMKHREMTGGKYSGHQHGGTCSVCGASAKYVVIWYHEESNSYIRTGEDCAQKMDMGEYGSFQRIKGELKAHAEAKAGKKKAQAILTEKGLIDVWTLFNATDEDLIELEIAERKKENRKCYCCIDGIIKKQVRMDGNFHLVEEVCDVCDGHYEQEVEFVVLDNRVNILVDIVRKLVRYGDLSDKQFKFLEKLASELMDIKAANAKREEEAAQERASSEPVPAGRQKVTGEIVSKRWEENGYGGSLKILVKDNRGFKVWGNCPSSISLRDKKVYQEVESTNYLRLMQGDGGHTEIRDGKLNYHWMAQVAIEKGDKVEFTATLEQSKDDDRFGFFKRPTKATVK